jgi:hypothetical protein
MLVSRNPEPQFRVTLVFKDPTVALDRLPGRDVLHIARDQRPINPQSSRHRQRSTQHRRRMTTATGRRTNVIADMTGNLPQAHRQPMPDRDPSQKCLVLHPPQRRHRNHSFALRRVLQRLSGKPVDIAGESARCGPVRTEPPDLLTQPALIPRRSAPFAPKLGHGSKERLADTYRRHTQTSHTSRVADPAAVAPRSTRYTTENLRARVNSGRYASSSRHTDADLRATCG